MYRPALPAAEGVADLTLIELFRQPVGPAGLEISDRARGLAGQRVRLCGYVARQAPPVPWKVLLSPLPVTLHDLEFGLCDDLPATAIRVELPRNLPPVLPPLRHLVAFTGTLELDGKDEADGRSVPLRLVVSPETFSAYPPLSVTNFIRVAVTPPVTPQDAPLAAGTVPVASQH